MRAEISPAVGVRAAAAPASADGCCKTFLPDLCPALPSALRRARARSQARPEAAVADGCLDVIAPFRIRTIKPKTAVSDRGYR
jgi:hypothetical protein